MVYSSIYIPIWLDLLFSDAFNHRSYFRIFTFQYGQIYYLSRNFNKQTISDIYIPIWLDLLFLFPCHALPYYLNLHSNMVRFIIHSRAKKSSRLTRFTFQYGQIYYAHIYYQLQPTNLYLHSNMVRFIINTSIYMVY